MGFRAKFYFKGIKNKTNKKYIMCHPFYDAKYFISKDGTLQNTKTL